MPLLISKRGSKHNNGDKFSNGSPPGLPLTVFTRKKKKVELYNSPLGGGKWRAKVVPAYHGLSYLQVSGTSSLRETVSLQGDP